MKSWPVAALCVLLAAAPALAQDARPGNVAVDRALLTAEEMAGAPVFGPAGEQFGAVGTLLIDPQGQVEAALVDLGGGVLGIGAKRVALPLDALSIERDGQSGGLRVYSAATAADLEAMPAFE